MHVLIALNAGGSLRRLPAAGEDVMRELVVRKDARLPLPPMLVLRATPWITHRGEFVEVYLAVANFDPLFAT